IEDTAEKESIEEAKETDDSNEEGIENNIEGELIEEDSEKESVEEKSDELDEDITEKDNSSLEMRNNSKIQESKTSLLGHINSGQENNYKTIGGTTFKAGTKHTKKVYYKKKQAKYGNEMYYQMSLNAKATNNLSWIKASDVKALKHTLINKTSEKKSIKGNGKGTRMARGGKQDTIHASMASHKGKTFHVNMKEAVGNGTWYRGKIEGKGANVWLKSNQVEAIKITESKTSLLGHINSGQANIYKTIGGSSFKAGSKHTNKVYYIKKQAKYGNELYYQMSLNSKATNNLGWMKASDVKALKHTLINTASE